MSKVAEVVANDDIRKQQMTRDMLISQKYQSIHPYIHINSNKATLQRHNKNSTRHNPQKKSSTAAAHVESLSEHPAAAYS